MDLQKVGIILDWTQLTLFHYIRSFLRFCNFYQYFIQDFSKLAKPLTSSIKKDTTFG